jgi:hypothetical protein
MSGLSPTEIVTLSFYAWEIRGRGWELAPYPVALEPPYRPFHILPGLVPETTVIDDGKRPTFMSSLIEGVKETFRSPKPSLPAPAEPFEEPAPFPAFDRIPLTTFQVLVSHDHETKPKVMLQLLSALGSTLHPVSLEIVGTRGGVRLQITCADIDRDHVAAQLFSFAPDVSVIEGENLIEALWDDGSAHRLIDFGLSQEFFLPLPPREAFPLDPYVPLIPALARAEEGEFVAVQILFERVRNPWGKAIRAAVSDGDGGCLFVDAPEFLRHAEEKTRTPLFAVSLRVAAQAEDSDRAWDLARGTGVFFRQFARPGANELLPLENTGYPDHDHADAFRTYRSFRTGMLLSAEELGALAHLPDGSVRHPAFVRSDRRTKALPSEAIGHALVLGKNIHRGKEAKATLGTEARLQHTWIIGASGSGKSNLLLNLILQDIGAGEGLAVLDPHGDLIDDILEQVPEKRRGDIVLLDPSDAGYPVGLNILSAGSEPERVLLASDLVGVFRRLSSNWGDTMGTVLGNAVLAILESSRGGTLLDLRRFLVDERFRKEFLQTVEDEEIRFFWMREYPLIGSRSIGPILTRLDTFLRPKLIRHIVGQKGGKLDLASLMRERKVFLVKLSQGLIGEENAYLLGSLLLGKFQELALSRQQLAKEERVPFYLYADEFQNFITPSLETLLTGARKYGVGLTLAHQTLAQLSPAPRVESALLGNAFTRIVFRTGEQDAKRLSEGFSFFDASDISKLGRGEAIVRLGSASNDFNLSTYPAPRSEDGEAERTREAISAQSRERYGTPLDTVKAAFEAQYGTKVTPYERSLIEKAEKSAIPSIEGLQEEPPAAEESSPQPVAEQRTAVRKEERKVPELYPSGRGGQEHKYLQHLVKRLGEERGFRASIEDNAGEGRADVVLRKEPLSVGVEISITTDTDHEAENLQKCIGASFTHVLFVSPNTRRRKELAKRFANSSPPVLVSSPEELVATLDALDPGATTETTVRGYKVKVTRQTMTPEELANRRQAVAGVIAKSIAKSKGEK